MVGRRETDGGFEVYRLPLPALAAAKEGITLPRYPTLPGRLKSRRAANRKCSRPTSHPEAKKIVHLLETGGGNHGNSDSRPWRRGCSPSGAISLEEVGLI